MVWVYTWGEKEIKCRYNKPYTGGGSAGFGPPGESLQDDPAPTDTGGLRNEEGGLGNVQWPGTLVTIYYSSS